MYPASPLLTQGADVNPDSLCSGVHGEGEECVHIKEVPLQSTVEIVLYDQGEILFHEKLRAKSAHCPVLGELASSYLEILLATVCKFLNYTQN
jgi:hypothetical protein